MIRESVTQGTAQQKCLDNNGIIASFHSDDEYNEAQKLCQSNYYNDGMPAGCWTGLRDYKNENIWYNNDGTVRDYLLNNDGSPKTGERPWADGEPNNAGGEDCVQIRGPKDWLLNDVSCSQEYMPICRSLEIKSKGDIKSGKLFTMSCENNKIIKIISATYGRNCINANVTNNVIDDLKAECGGKQSCTYHVDHNLIGHPGCSEIYDYEYECKDGML